VERPQHTPPFASRQPRVHVTADTVLARGAPPLPGPGEGPTHVIYVYGDELGQYAGRVKKGKELDKMAAEYGEFRVYVVEVCQSCAWNHLATSYVLGTGEPPARRGRRARSGQ
jgi:hypothetical protein